MNTQGRPLSPHLSVYRWPITMTLSILHRISGGVLTAGFVVLVLWIASIAAGGATYADMQSLLGSMPGRLALIGWSFAFFFHLSNGIRHLVWDTGVGLEKQQATRSAWFVVVLSTVATLVYWLIVA